MPTAPQHVYLIDGSGFIFRAFHAVRPLTRPDGTPVNAVYGFTQMLMKILGDTDADCLAVIFDAARLTFRNDIFPDYKANRAEPPDELVPQFDLVRQAVRAFNVPSIEMPGFEADDIIATYARMAKEAGARVTIVSSDKDLMQLVDDRVTMFDAMKNQEIAAAQVIERFGLGPEKVVEIQALAGDSSDNVPGVPGIGVKTAAQLLAEFGDLDTLLARAGEIKQPKRRQTLLDHADQARLSRRLVQLRDDVPIERPLEDFCRIEVDAEALIKFLKEQDFKSILARVEAQHGIKRQEEAAAPEPDKGEHDCIQDLAALERFVAAATEAGYVAVHTETTSPDPMRAELVGISLSIRPGYGCYIPLAHRAANGQGALDLGSGPGTAARDPKQIPMRDAIDALQPLMSDPAVLKIGHDIKYDANVLARHGLPVEPIDDTLLISFVLDGGAGKHGMDDLADRHLNYKTVKYKEIVGSGKAQVTFDRVPLDVACKYAAEDADVTLRLHRLLKPRLLAERMVSVYETIERPLIPVLAAMERKGILVDPAALRALSRDFAQRLGGMEDEIYTLAGETFNIGSPKQLGEVLFDKLGMQGAGKTKTGAYRTDQDVLEELAAAGYELPEKVLQWRQIAKLKSTYTDTLVEQINPETGRIHTCYAMAGAQTGRLSSTDPNLQNIPVRSDEGRKIRQAFRAREGCKLVSLDYSQIELRIVAHMAGIDALVQAFHDGADIHAMTASQVFGIPMKDMDPITRRKAKAINFGIIYGISAFGLARQLGIEQREAKAYIDAYFQKYPGIRVYMEMVRAACRKSGRVETLFGRRIHLPGITEKNPARRGYAERQAINAPIQGTAADIIKRAMIRIPDTLREKRLSADMLLQVHDELLFEVPEAQVDETIAAVRSVMEGAAGPAVTLAVPLVVEAGIGDNWEEAH